MQSVEIEKITEKWFRYKQELSEIEKKVQKYKELLEEEMNKQGVNYLTTKRFEISRISCSKNTISKKDVPKEVWDAYSKRSKYFMYSLKEIKGK
jgi:hypothetical protein